MYQSRYHFTNGMISVAVDSLTGELLEIVYEKTGENLIKNSAFSLRQPFSLAIRRQTDGKAAETRVFGGNVYEIAKDPSLRPRIESGEDASGVYITVSYDRLTDGKTSFAIAARVEMTLPAGEARVLWRLSLQNKSGLILAKVQFPCVNGIWFGESWEDDTLIYPRGAGMKIENPVGRFGGPHRIVQWKWQEYRYGYELKNPAAGPDEDGLFSLSGLYSGFLSMTWLDYYGSDIGLYFGCHDPDRRVVGLNAQTWGDDMPGMHFSFTHFPQTEAESWQSPPVILAVHDGDWHAGARIYRAFRESAPNATVMPKTRPEWFEKSVGLVAHYDFEYQNGEVVHRYAELPELLAQAKELGINHLLIAGWHQDGFDHGFPAYLPDEKLGTEEELKAGIRAVRESGGHISFYVNSRLANTKYDALAELIEQNVVRRPDREADIMRFGNHDLSFAAMCLGAAEWRKKLAETLVYLTEGLGIDSVYFDMLAMAQPGMCCEKGHGHQPDEWNESGRKLEGAVTERYLEAKGEKLCLLHEGVSDSYGDLCAGQLVQTFYYYHIGAFSEMYRYTFPEQILVDMVYPKRNMAMRPVHIGQISTALIEDIFITGGYFWIYDLVDDNSFTRDPEQYAFLKETLALRKFWLDRFGHGRFVDTDRMEVSGSRKVKRFDLTEGALFACAGTARAVLTLADAGFSRLTAYYPEGGRIVCETLAPERKNDALSFALPRQAVCIAVLER